jgi:hypothetical protein
MQKKIGFIFGLFFIVIAIVNFIDAPIFFCLNVIGLGLVGVAFIESSYFDIYGKILQIVTLLFYSGIAVVGNDPNSLVSVLTLFVVVLISDKYFPQKKNLSKYYTMVPLMTALLSDWKITSIVTNLLLYITFTVVVQIIQNDKV